MHYKCSRPVVNNIDCTFDLQIPDDVGVQNCVNSIYAVCGLYCDDEFYETRGNLLYVKNEEVTRRCSQLLILGEIKFL